MAHALTKAGVSVLKRLLVPIARRVLMDSSPRTAVLHAMQHRRVDLEESADQRTGSVHATSSSQVPAVSCATPAILGLSVKFSVTQSNLATARASVMLMEPAVATIIIME